MLLFIISAMVTFQVLGQNNPDIPYISKDNNTGYWNDPATWTDRVDSDNNDLDDYEQEEVGEAYTIIKGMVKWEATSTTDSTLNFNLGGNPPGQGDTALVVKDTLVVYGNIFFANSNNLYIEEGGVLIVYGDLGGTNKIVLDPQGYLIVQGDLNFNNEKQQEITTEGDNVYVGGDISNCNDCQNTGNDSTDLVTDSLDVYDFYQGEDPDNPVYSITPGSTDICSRSPQRVTLYFSGADDVQELSWQVSSDGSTYSDIADAEGQSSYTVTLTETRYYRIEYIPEGGTESSFSDTAVVYCESLCTMTASISEADQTACYADDVSIDFTSAISDGTSPYTYSWEISSSDDPNPENIITSPDNTSEQVTFSNFPNPEATSWQYTVTLTASDDESCTDTDTQTIILQRRPETGNTYYVPNEFDRQ